MGGEPPGEIDELVHRRPRAGEGVEDRDHGGADGDEHAALDEEDAPFLAVDLVVGEVRIVEVVLAGQPAGHADAGIDQDAERDHRLDQGGGTSRLAAARP